MSALTGNARAIIAIVALCVVFVLGGPALGLIDTDGVQTIVGLILGFAGGAGVEAARRGGGGGSV